MNSKESYKDDLLKGYILPGRSDKAPDGFTSKVMSRVALESISAKKQKINLVPYISGVVTIIFLVTAFLIPGKQTDPLSLPFLKLINNIKISIPDINLSSIHQFSLPSVMIYAVLGILILIVLDRALNGIFKKS
jgi:hypothetical protein